MKQISTSAELKAAIAELQKKKEIQQLTIKGQVAQTKQALKPSHLLKNTYSYIAETPEIKRTLISTLIGIGIGYFSKKATAALQEDKLDRMINNFVDKGLDQVVQNNPNALLSKAVSLTRQVARETR
jgi:hypothetical protein